MRDFGKGFFDNVLGMSPGAAGFMSSLVSNALLSSAFYVGISSVTMPAHYSGPDYSQAKNQDQSFLDYKSHTYSGQGGSSANYVKSTINDRIDMRAKFEYIKEGAAASEVAFKGTPGLEQLNSALNIRHSVALINVNGILRDSAADVSLLNFSRGVVYGSPWTAVCHQATFNALSAGGMGAFSALGATFSQAGWSYSITSSIYGINGGYGLSSIMNAVERN